MKLQKSLDDKGWTEEDKETVNRLIKRYRDSRKQKNIQDAIDIINKRRMHNSMFVSAEMEVLNEPDEVIKNVMYESKQLYKAQQILENIEKIKSK
jgi:cytochrome oxidase Cu insertion factor (SCO1/SenC/PrrC family)